MSRAAARDCPYARIVLLGFIKLISGSDFAYLTLKFCGLDPTQYPLRDTLVEIWNVVAATRYDNQLLRLARRRVQGARVINRDQRIKRAVNEEHRPWTNLRNHLHGIRAGIGRFDPRVSGCLH